MLPNKQRLIRRLYTVACVLRTVSALGLLSVSGCQAYDNGEFFRKGKTLTEINLTQADNGKSIQIGLGEIVRISLDENPSTGFRWALEQGNDKVLELLTSDYIQASAPRVGVGGQRVWRFAGKKSGDVRLVMVHRRAWNEERSTVVRLQLTIRVVD